MNFLFGMKFLEIKKRPEKIANITYTIYTMRKKTSISS